ncbi:MAG: ABC transporter permease [Gemmatimonadales bacterium]|nr:ABC transporter permease [Gemmatimonadales bacterium]
MTTGARLLGSPTRPVTAPGESRRAWGWPTALERRIARRYLGARSSSRFANLTTRIAIGGVAVGVAALIVVLGIITGLHNDLRDKILVGNPHIHVLTFGANLEVADWRAVLDSVRKDPEVVAAAPEVLVKSVIVNSANYPAAVDVFGIDPDTGRASVTPLPKAVSEGALSFKATRDSVDGTIILGHRLAERLSTYQGDVVRLVSVNDLRKVNRALGVPTFRPWYFEVVGTFNTGMFQYDDAFAVMRIDQAQRFAGLGDAVSGIQVRVADAWRATEVARRLADGLGYPYRTIPWQEQNASLFGAMKLEKLGMGLVITFITIVAAFNIIGTLTMIVGERTREIGILLAMGLTPAAIGRVFVAQGAIIGLVGTAIGLVLGLVISFVLDGSELIRIDPSIYFIDHLPVTIEPLDVAVVVSVSLAIALAATIPASRAASRLQPVDAIRHE